MTIATQIANRIGSFLSGLPPEQYAKKKHKSLSGQGEFRWITIGGEAIEGEGNHVGGTPVQIRGSTGEIVKGPDTLTGKKVGELGKSKDKAAPSDVDRDRAVANMPIDKRGSGSVETAKNPDFDPSQAVKVSADDITKLRQSDVFRVVEWTPSEHRQSVVDYITKERPDLAEEASDVMEELGGSPKSDDKDSVTFQTAGEAASSGKSFAQWSGPISDAFVREEIDDSHPSWKSIQAGTAPTVNEYNDARSLYGQHVTPMNGGKFGKVTELSDDARSANVSHADGSASWHRIDSLHHLGALIESRSKSGGVLSNRMHAEYIAPFLAMESMENGENIGETMKRHGISPLNKDVRNAIVKHKDMMNSEKEVQPSEARKRAMLASARNAEKDNATRVDDRPSNKPVETANTPEASPAGSENFDHLPMMERLDAHQQAIRNGTATADQVRQWYKWASSPETKEALRAELSKKTIAQLKDMGAGSFYTKTKDDYVKNMLNKIGEQYHVGQSLSWSMNGSREEALNKAIEAQTDQNIKDYSERVTQAKAERQAQIDKIVKAIKDPQTLEDFETRQRFAKDKTLTPEQQARYDELRGITRREKEAEAKTEVAGVTGVSGLDAEIKEGFHAKKQKPTYVAVVNQRVDKDKYNELNAAAKKLGGYYSSFKGAGAIPGFQFDSQEAAAKFQQIVRGQSVDRSDILAERQEVKATSQAKSLRERAASMKAEAEAELGRDRLTNTHRRATMSASIDARNRLKVAQAETMAKIADGIEAGELKHLSGVKAATHVEALQRAFQRAKHDGINKRDVGNRMSYKERESERERPPSLEDVEHAKYPYPGLHRDNFRSAIESLAKVPGIKNATNTLMSHMRLKDDGYVTFDDPKHIEAFEKIASKLKGHPSRDLKWLSQNMNDAMADYNRLQQMNIKDVPELRAALREFHGLRTNAKSEDPIKAAERSLIGKKIDGFFPTPRPLIERMLDEADIKPGMSVLEPSAGKGDILDAIKERHGDQVTTQAIEPNSTLRDLIGMKGHNLEGHDFLEHTGQHDRIVMNPPFENHQDIKHVRHAYDRLAPGGKLVAVISAGGGKQREEFDRWLDDVGGTVEPLPQGSFSGSDAFRQTGVNTRLVVVQKSGSPEKYSLSHGIWDAVSSAVDRYAMRQPGLFDESKHPRGDDGRFVTIPASHTFGEMQGEVNRNHDGTATISRVGKSGERDSLVKMHESQVSTFLNDLGGKVESDTRSPDESVNRVLDGNAKFLGRGNDGLAFDTLDGNVVKVSSDVGYHWNNGVRPPGEGATRTKKAAELNNKLKADGVNGLLHHEIVEHDGRTFLKMPKLEIPEKFTQDQLRQITETVKALHANGYSIGDEIQPGVDKHGNAYIYDTGTLSESGRYGVEDDNGHLERLWNKSGMEFGGTDPDLVYQSHFEPAFRLLKNPLRFGEKHWQAHKDRLENAWKNVTPEMKELLSDSHEEAIRGIDRQIKEARARKSENDASNSDQGKSESAQEVLSGRTKPSVPGQQQSLFGGDSPTGQQSLFNIAKPSAKAKPKEVATKIAGRIGDLLAGKETVSPADMTIPIQGESLPGQKTMFSRPGRPIRYEARWVTLGKKGDENRPRIQIEDDGTVKKGPPSLMNENLGDKSRGAERRAKAAHAAVAGKTGKDLTAAKADALAGDQRMQQYNAAKQAAKVAGVSVKEVLSLLPEAQQYLNEQIAEREKSRARARALTGMTAGRIAQVENSHRDWSTVPGFDERSRDVAMEHPELGFDPDDADTPSKVWDLIREGAESSVPLHAPEVAELAATWAKPTKAKKQDDLDSVPFSRHATDSPERGQVSLLKQIFPRGASKKIDDA